MPARDAGERRQIAKIAALSRSARESGKDRMARANEVYRTSFRKGHECAVCRRVDIDPSLPPEEIARRGEVLYRLHMQRLARRRDRSQRLTAEYQEAADIASEELARLDER